MSFLGRSLSRLQQIALRNPQKSVGANFGRKYTTAQPAEIINDNPSSVQFGLIKLVAVLVPFVWFGGSLAKNGAAFLEENDIFVPTDEDD